MAIVKTDNKHYKNIADALREGIEAPDSQFPPNDMAEAIRYANEVSYNNGSSDGYGIGFEEGEEFGYQSGYSSGYDEGLADGTKTGKKAEHDAFWDAFQSNGNRTDYYRAFCNATNLSLSLGWNEVTFRPKYDLKVTTIAQGFTTLNVGDLDAHLKNCGVVLDTSACTNFQQAFQGAKITVFPELHIKKVTDLNATFNNCSSLITIRKIIFDAPGCTFSGTFTGCSRLVNIDEVEGCIERNISFSSSPLSAETMKRIISCLKDYSGTESENTYTVTFKSTAFETLETEGATAEYNGVACTWAELIDNLKWNLVTA